MAREVKRLWTYATEPFGEPTLYSMNNSDAVWSRGSVSPTYQKSSTGWMANLYGGVQTNDDFAAIFIPVNEMKLPDFASAKWSYYMTSTQTMGVNIVIWAHDPTDFDKRAEITQLGGHADLEKAAGWNAFEFKNSTGGMFYYGENVSGSGLTAGTQYTWLQFLQDALFKTWTIYRISIEYGWEASGTFNDVWVADVQLDGHMIPLQPDSQGTGRIGHRYFEVETGDLSGTLAPKTPFRLLNMSVHVDAVPDTGEDLTLTVDSGYNGTDSAHFDTVIFSDDLFVGSRTSLFVPFGEGYDFPADYEIDLFQTNGSDDDWGVSIAYQTVFA